MKKNNRLFLSLMVLFMIEACADKGPEDPLIVPPNFESMPDVNSANKNTPPKPADPDTAKLRELLLKGNQEQ